LNEEIANSKNEIQILNDEVIKGKEEIQKHEEELENLKYAQKKMVKENLAHSLREELKDGEICPVCGSTHHIKENIKIIQRVDLNKVEEDIKNKEIIIKEINNKIIEGETKAASFTEKIKRNIEEIEQLGTKFKEKSLDVLKVEFDNLRAAIDKYGKDKEKLEKNINELKIAINLKNGEINELRAIVRTNQKQLGDLEESLKINITEAADLENKLKLLRSETEIEDFNKKNEEIKITEKERERISKLIKDDRQLLERLENQRKILNDELTSIKEKLAKYKADLSSYEKNREEKLQAIKNKVNDEENLEFLLETVQREIKNINEEFEKLEESKNKVEKEFANYNEALIGAISKDKDLSKRRKDQEATLEAAITSEGFNSLEEVKKNLIEKKQLGGYKEIVSSYKEDLSKLIGAIENLSSKIKGRELTEETYEKVKSLKAEKEKEVNEFTENKIKVDEELKNIKEKLKAQKDLLEKKKELEHKLALLGDLEKLFKGKKFVEFVAANKLKYVSIEASKRLKEITGGNYGLEVDENGRFIIRDYKNGGAQRDASTLSGGETFLASLSLALALSAQIQLKGTAPLELFFLDEGFGTLDDDLLEVVMSSLERIHNDKLKVGIISHVEAIKNRVPVKLMITPAEAGMGGSKVKIERS
jgi:ATPase involved in DNA repair